jgi:hypothetical protein
MLRIRKVLIVLLLSAGAAVSAPKMGAELDGMTFPPSLSPRPNFAPLPIKPDPVFDNDVIPLFVPLGGVVFVFYLFKSVFATMLPCQHFNIQEQKYFFLHSPPPIYYTIKGALGKRELNNDKKDKKYAINQNGLLVNGGKTNHRIRH